MSFSSLSQAEVATTVSALPQSLDADRASFIRTRFIAMPIAGALAWLLIGMVGICTVNPLVHTWTLFIATGVIVYLGMFISKFTGEHFLARNRPKNAFDTLFFFTVGQALISYAIVLPVANLDHTFLPLGVGILSGTMWLPLSWMIKHPVGFFHVTARTLGIVALHYAFPDLRFVAIPFWIVAVYLVTIFWLERRYRRVNQLSSDLALV